MISLTFAYQEEEENGAHVAEYEIDAFARDAQIEDFEITVTDEHGKLVDPTIDMYSEARRRLLAELFQGGTL